MKVVLDTPEEPPINIVGLTHRQAALLAQACLVISWGSTQVGNMDSIFQQIYDGIDDIIEDAELREALNNADDTWRWDEYSRLLKYEGNLI